MKKHSIKLSIASLLAVGIIVAMFSPVKGGAATNTVIASVEWVMTQINPINTKISSLEAKVAQQQQQINELAAAIEGSGDTPPSTGDDEPAAPTTVYVNKNNVTIHKGATRSYDVIYTANTGKSFTVIDTYNGSSGTWYRVSISSTLKGWVYSGDISTSPVSATTPTKVVTTSAVNIRKGATTSYDIVETVASGVTLKYIQSFTNSAGQLWYNIETVNGNRGWMISTYGEVK